MAKTQWSANIIDENWIRYHVEIKTIPEFC